MHNQKCPICKGEASSNSLGGRARIQCDRCGNYEISDVALSIIEKITVVQTANLSGWIRERQDYLLEHDNLLSLLNLKSPSVGEKADKLLILISQTNAKPGGLLMFSHFFGNNSQVMESYMLKDDPTLRSVQLSTALGRTWSEDRQELDYLIRNYLCDETGFISSPKPGYYQITPNGWAHLYSLQHSTAAGNLGFIAMWFNPSLDSVHKIMEEAIQASGYKPLRIDKHPHNNKIDDEILAAIRRSYFVVCDFTGQRGGVYFEAGFALGLGRPVIWLCEKEEVDKIHFDNRQYNFILWKKDELSDLKKSLRNRIVATIGQGPLPIPDERITS